MKTKIEYILLTLSLILLSTRLMLTGDVVLFATILIGLLVVAVTSLNYSINSEAIKLSKHQIIEFLLYIFAGVPFLLGLVAKTEGGTWSSVGLLLRSDQSSLLYVLMGSFLATSIICSLYLRGTK